MLRFLRWLAGFVCALILAVLAILNTQPVAFRWSPFAAGHEAPLAYYLLGFAAAGFLIGALCVWLNHWPVYRALAQQKRKAAALQAHLNASESQNPRAAPRLPGLADGVASLPFFRKKAGNKSS